MFLLVGIRERLEIGVFLTDFSEIMIVGPQLC
jgi:hypothetical protein